MLTITPFLFFKYNLIICIDLWGEKNVFIITAAKSLLSRGATHSQVPGSGCLWGGHRPTCHTHSEMRGFLPYSPFHTQEHPNAAAEGHLFLMYPFLSRVSLSVANRRGPRRGHGGPGPAVGSPLSRSAAPRPAQDAQSNPP